MSGGGARGAVGEEGAPRGGVARARRRRGRRVLAAHPDEAHVGRKVLEARVLALGDVLLHRAEVHRLLDQPRVVVQPHLLPVDGLGKVDRLRALQQRLEVGVALPAQRLVHRVEDEPRLRPLVAVPALRAGEGARLRLSSGRDSDGTRRACRIAGATSSRAAPEAAAPPVFARHDGGCAPKPRRRGGRARTAAARQSAHRARPVETNNRRTCP